MHRRSAFTLVELLVVIAIIAVLAIVVVLTIDALLQQKLQLQSQLSTLLCKCQDDAQKAVVRGAYQRACDQWNEAVNKKLVGDATMLSALAAQLGQISDQLKQSIEQGEAIDQVIGTITSGITVGAKLVMLLR